MTNKPKPVDWDPGQFDRICTCGHSAAVHEKTVGFSKVIHKPCIRDAAFAHVHRPDGQGYSLTPLETDVRVWCEVHAAIVLSTLTPEGEK